MGTRRNRRGRFVYEIVYWQVGQHDEARTMQWFLQFEGLSPKPYPTPTQDAKRCLCHSKGSGAPVLLKDGECVGVGIWGLIRYLNKNGLVRC